MPFGSYDTPKPTPVPTFLQYTKSCSKGIESKTRFQVDIIWLPGKFDNVTLQTHAFRYICDSNHPLYNDVKAFFESEDSKGVRSRLDIVIDSLESKTISVLEHPKAKGEWTKLGSNAMKFQPN